MLIGLCPDAPADAGSVSGHIVFRRSGCNPIWTKRPVSKKGIEAKAPDTVFTPISPVESVNLVVGFVNLVAFSLWEFQH